MEVSEVPHVPIHHLRQLASPQGHLPALTFTNLTYHLFMLFTARCQCLDKSLNTNQILKMKVCRNQWSSISEHSSRTVWSRPESYPISTKIFKGEIPVPEIELTGKYDRQSLGLTNILIQEWMLCHANLSVTFSLASVSDVLNAHYYMCALHRMKLYFQLSFSYTPSTFVQMCKKVLFLRDNYTMNLTT